MTHAVTGRDVRPSDPPLGTTPPTPRQTSRLRAETRAGIMVWRREMAHFRRDLPRVAFSLLQPVLYLYILGVGLSRLMATVQNADDYLLFLFPGVLVMAVQQPAITVGSSIVWDRQSGFLREMLVAPVARTTLLIGKCLGGTSVATCQAAVVLASAGLIGIPYRLDLFAVLFAELLLSALAMTVLAAALAVSFQRIQTFNVVLTALFIPLTFLSGIMFPLSAMPGWMAAVAVVNPMTYAVDAMRRTVVADYPGHGVGTFFDPITWGGWQVPTALELGLVALFSLVMLALANHRFCRVA